ncbi:MAG: TIGR02186 family protein [Rhodovibrionaceae bacterium]
MIRRAAAALILAAALLWAPGAARAADLVADLSDHLVAITTGFAGIDVLLYGAVGEPGDIIVVVRGPERRTTLRRKSQVAGIWMNTNSMAFERVPVYYAVASSGPLSEIAAAGELSRLQIGVENLRPSPLSIASANIVADWRAALIRNKQRAGLYVRRVGSVSFLADTLFRTKIHFPANVPTGIYLAEVYLLRNGLVVGAQTTPLNIRKAGTEADLYDFAHEQSGLYGLVAVFLALMAGWLAHLAFRRD